MQQPLRLLGAFAVLGIASSTDPAVGATPGGDAAAGWARGSRAAPPATQVQAACPDRRSIRNLYFGDLHVHTSYSFDAFAWGSRGSPGDAYTLGAAALDFTAVTDHAEFLAETELCRDPDSPAFHMLICQDLRSGQFDGDIQQLCVADPPLIDPVVCAEAADRVWSRIQEAAHAAYRPCEYTTFVAYEYSRGSVESTAVLHRNVFFRGRTVPAKPGGSLEFTTPQALWNELDLTCRLEDGCQVIAIPHNSNRSEGEAFAPVDAEGRPIDALLAAQRVRLEPLVEIFQHKGSSECYPNVGNSDADCKFEQLPDSLILPPGGSEIPRLSFVREALKEGLQLRQTIGVNPFELGFVAATDTHNATPGAADEASYSGHVGNRDDTAAKRLASATFSKFNAGGLTAVWAKENTRSGIFKALRAREVYATSGTRITVRFFGGWDYPGSLCSESSPIPLAYQQGVPMGGRLGAPSSPAPGFFVLAQRDPGGSGLQAIQIVKGWIDGGALAETVYTVKESALPGGASMMCTLWTDPDFDASQPAFYYARLLEAPTPRWSTLDCQAAGIDCADPDGIPPSFARCCNGRLPETIAERAWTSPIWYQP